MMDPQEGPRLPLDLISQISLYLSQSDLLHLAVTSREIEALTRRLLFSDVRLERDWEQVEQFCSCLKTRPYLSSFVQILRIHLSEIWYSGESDIRSLSEAEQQDLVSILSSLSPTLRQLYLGPSIDIQDRISPGVSGLAVDAIFATIKNAPSIELLSFQKLFFPPRTELADILNKRKCVRFLSVSGGPFHWNPTDLSKDIVFSLEELNLYGACGLLISGIDAMCQDARFRRSSNLKKLKISYSPYNAREVESIFSVVKSYLTHLFVSLGAIIRNPESALKVLHFDKIQHLTLCFDYFYFGIISDHDDTVRWMRDFTVRSLMPINGLPFPLMTFEMAIYYPTVHGNWYTFMTESGPSLGRLLEETFTDQVFPRLRYVTLSLPYCQKSSRRRFDRLTREKIAQTVRGAAPRLVEGGRLRVVVEPSLEKYEFLMTTGRDAHRT